MRDWFDDYLDGMNQYKIVNVAPDNIVAKNKQNLNILQKKMLFDAAAISEAEMRILMESKRDEEMAHHDSHGGDSDNKKTAAVPAVIPVATTNAIRLNRNGVLGAGTNYAWNSSNLANLIRDEYTNPTASVTLTKRGASSVQEYFGLASNEGNDVDLYIIPNATYFLNIGETRIFLGKTGTTPGYLWASSQTIPAGTWFAAFINSYGGGDYYGNDPVYVASNPSTNFTVIPQTGWTAQTAETIVAI